MQVSLKLVGTLVDQLPDAHPLENARGTNVLQLSGEQDVSGLLRHVGLSIDSEYFAMINGDHVRSDELVGTKLNDGDAVILVPTMKGG